MTDFASEFTRIFHGGSSISGYDWSQKQLFDGTDPDNCYSNEAALMASITSEAYNKFGIEVDYYIKNISTKRDVFMGEDPLENIVRRFKLNVYTEQVPNLQKQYAIQGMIYTEMVTVQCTIVHFDEASRYNYEQTYSNDDWATVPKIGDLMYFKYCDKYYEILNAKKFDEGTTFLGTPITYTFVLRMWRNNHEDVELLNENPSDEPSIEDFTSLAETFDIENQTSTVEASGDIFAINDEIEKPKVANKRIFDSSNDIFDGW